MAFEIIEVHNCSIGLPDSHLLSTLNQRKKKECITSGTMIWSYVVIYLVYKVKHKPQPNYIFDNVCVSHNNFTLSTLVNFYLCCSTVIVVPNRKIILYYRDRMIVCSPIFALLFPSRMLRFSDQDLSLSFLTATSNHIPRPLP